MDRRHLLQNAFFGGASWPLWGAAVKLGLAGNISGAISHSALQSAQYGGDIDTAPENPNAPLSTDMNVKDSIYSRAIAGLEAEYGGRLGVALWSPFDKDASGGGYIGGHRSEERFALCSTFKLLLAAFILRQCDIGKLSLDKKISYSQSDILSHAPETQKYISRGYMTVEQLAKAAQISSDNVAANLLLPLIGGPKGFTKLLRFFGDDVTRLDRIEPMLNFVPMGETRDTTSPSAISSTIAQIFTAGLLTDASAATLRQWTMATNTGPNRLRKYLDADWVAGNKTGTAYGNGSGDMAHKFNDIALLWDKHRQGNYLHYIITAYYEAPINSDPKDPKHEEILAQIGKITREFIHNR
ncbi:hypothetical protein LPB140_04380 [Sphingorhabdus lutea]|uniref:Beta-lactamase n=1 Tax=Sphingorhabdus lutea TaxID=1913578 RepID=A0A1L3JAM6_9SPHN|nr:class A beta-lactamase [Sphingorhabdus lutea]APG62169.1 hypothetical protein LPB140_04380 [Sphingorhabdus lutea]